MRCEYPRPPWFDLAGEIAWFLAEEMARRRHRRLKRPPVARGKTLRPGTNTPIWNLLAARVEPLLRRRGAKALLARELGLHRARMTDFFVTGSAMPDAERLLRLLGWLAAQRARVRASVSAAPAPAPAPSVPVNPMKVRNTNIR